MLTGFGFQIGKILVDEGINDIMYSVRAALNGGKFSWKDYGKMKCISLLTNIAILGIKYLKSGKSFADFMKSPVNNSEIAKQILKASIKEVTLECGRFGLKKLIEGTVIDKIIQEIRAKMR